MVGQEVILAEVEVRSASGSFEVVADGEVVYTARSEMEARSIAPYVQSQLAAGISAKNVGRLLRGESVKSAEGGSGDEAVGASTGKSEPAPKKAAAPKKAEAPAERKAPAPKKAQKASDGGADLSLLNGSIGKLKKALATGEHDAHLAELLAAEEAGKDRKGAKDAIEERKG